MRSIKSMCVLIFTISVWFQVGCRVDRDDGNSCLSSTGSPMDQVEKLEVCWGQIGSISKVLGYGVMPVVYFIEDRLNPSQETVHFGMPQKIVESVSEKLSRKIDAQFNSYIQTWLDDKIVMLIRRNIDFLPSVWYFEQV